MPEISHAEAMEYAGMDDWPVTTGDRICAAGEQWLRENPNFGVPYSMTPGYWNVLVSMLRRWGFDVVERSDT